MQTAAASTPALDSRARASLAAARCCVCSPRTLRTSCQEGCQCWVDGPECRIDSSDAFSARKMHTQYVNQKCDLCFFVAVCMHACKLIGRCPAFFDALCGQESEFLA
eukprot:6190901-Pleurochrysis_carterae.AAC.1